MVNKVDSQLDFQKLANSEQSQSPVQGLHFERLARYQH